MGRGLGVGAAGAAGAAAAAAAGAAAASNHLATAPPEAAGGQSERAARLEAMADALTSFPDVPEVTVGQLLADLASGAAVLVDVRSPAEVAVSTFGADPAVTGEEFDRDPARWAGRRVVCACTVGYRSRKKAQELRAAGVEAANLRGGILAWTHAGLPLVDPAGLETKRVHVYAPRWALQAEGYTPVVFQTPLHEMAWQRLRSLFKRGS